MTAVALTAPEHTEVLVHTDVAEPTQRPTVFGGRQDLVARLVASLPETHTRASGQPIPPGFSGRAYDLVEGSVSVTPAAAHHWLDVTGATLSRATARVILAAVGERGDRHCDVDFAFKETSG